jgi:hypothetical protein
MKNALCLRSATTPAARALIIAGMDTKIRTLSFQRPNLSFYRGAVDGNGSVQTLQKKRWNCYLRTIPSG